ncbi:MAG TPA: hypothetical protein VFQ39_15845 [Longimicrobium sp.]|nr:hypothetical protein [Longimicrobium sp.]
MSDAVRPSIHLAEQLAVHAGEEFTLHSVPLTPETARVELSEFSRDALSLETAGFERTADGAAHLFWTFRALRPGESTLRFTRHIDAHEVEATRSVHVQVFG